MSAKQLQRKGCRRFINSHFVAPWSSVNPPEDTHLTLVISDGARSGRRSYLICFCRSDARASSVSGHSRPRQIFSRSWDVRYASESDPIFSSQRMSAQGHEDRTTVHPQLRSNNSVESGSIRQARRGDRFLEQRLHRGRDVAVRGDLEVQARRCTALHVGPDLALKRRDPAIVPGIRRQRQICRVKHCDTDAACLDRRAPRRVERSLAAGATERLRASAGIVIFGRRRSTRKRIFAACCSLLLVPGVGMMVLIADIADGKLVSVSLLQFEEVRQLLS